MKIKDKLSKEQRKALKEIQQINNNTKVYPVDKTSVFIVLSEGDKINKIEEYLVRTEVIDKDLRQKYIRKIHKHLCKLRKEINFADKEYFKIYTSDPIPPQLYGTVKAQTRKELSHTPPYAICKYLVKIIQPTLKRVKMRLA